MRRALRRLIVPDEGRRRGPRYWSTNYSGGHASCRSRPAAMGALWPACGAGDIALRGQEAPEERRGRRCVALGRWPVVQDDISDRRRWKTRCRRAASEAAHCRGNNAENRRGRFERTAAANNGRYGPGPDHGRRRWRPARRPEDVDIFVVTRPALNSSQPKSTAACRVAAA